tara:strand:- start:219 stop:419 length:201 start_codon:yes stop_codon:yes gene_type:complete
MRNIFIGALLCFILYRELGYDKFIQIVTTEYDNHLSKHNNCQNEDQEIDLMPDLIINIENVDVEPE